MSRAGIILTLVSLIVTLSVQGTSLGQINTKKVNSIESFKPISLPSSAVAEKARQRRNRVSASAAEDYQKTRANANKEYLADLTVSLKKSIKKGNLEESQRLKSEIKLLLVEIVAQTAPAVYLADLPPANVRVSHGKLGLNGDLGYNDTRVVVNKREAKHSISLHAADDGVVGVGYVMPPQFTLLSGAAALNSSSKRPSMKSSFRVVGDGRILWESSKVSKKPIAFKIDVSGVSYLRLLIDTQGSAGSGHTVWLEPMLTR